MRLLVPTCLLVASCSSSTGLQVQVQGDAKLINATVAVFDPHGIIGKTQLTSPLLPGQVTVTGLGDSALDLRVVVDGNTNSATIIGGARVVSVPHAITTTTIVLNNPPDQDKDGIPDALDDCPTVADPTQANSAGTGRGDACRSLPPNTDMAILGVQDFGASDVVTHDFAASMPDDMAQPPSPPDLMPGPSLCGSAGALFCDGFESEALMWGPLTINGTLTVDSTHVYRGEHALHLHQDAIPGNTGQDTAVGISTQTYPTTDVYLRAWVYLPGPAPTGAFTFLRAQQSGGSQWSLDLDVTNNAFGTRASRTGTLLSSTTAPPLDRWFCVEWQLHLATSGYTIVNVDGNPVSGLQMANTFDTTNSPNYDWLVIGLDSAGTANPIPARDLWLDEIVLDNKPIGCAK